MPRLVEHLGHGRTVGAGAAAYMARDQHLAALACEVMGGAMGGMLGARLPDILEPPVSPHHRAVAHGVLPVASAAIAVVQKMPERQADLRAMAAEQLAMARRADSTLEEVLRFLVAAGLHVIAGVLPGVVAGYVVHIAADAQTPRGVPAIA